MTDYYAVWATCCEDCQTKFVAYPHPDKAESFPGPDGWVEEINCPVCWGDLHWERNVLIGDHND